MTPRHSARAIVIFIEQAALVKPAPGHSRVFDLPVRLGEPKPIPCRPLIFDRGGPGIVIGDLVRLVFLRALRKTDDTSHSRRCVP